MGHERATAVSILVGVIYGIAWTALIDGAHFNATFTQGVPYRMVAHERQPPYQWYYVIPAVLITLCMAAMNILSARDLRSEYGSDEEGRFTAKKGYVFTVITIAIMAMGGATWIASANLGGPIPLSHGVHPTLPPGEPDWHPWPGMSLVVNAFLQLIGGIIFFAARYPL